MVKLFAAPKPGLEAVGVGQRIHLIWLVFG